MSIAKHSFYNAAGMVAPMLVSLVTIPIYLGQIGIERFGILALCWTVLGQLGFLNLGLGPALTQKLASDRHGEETDPSRLFWTAAWLNIVMALLAGALIFAVAPYYFATLSDLPADIRGEIGPAVPFLAATVPVAMMVSVPNGALVGREKFLAQNVIGSLSSVLVAVLPLAASFVFGPRLDYLIAAALIGRVASLLFLYRACVPAVPVRRPTFDGGLLKPLLVFGGWMTLVNMIAPLVVTADRFIIGGLLGAAAVSIYVIPYQLAQKLRIIPHSLVQALFPRMAYSNAEQRDRLVTEGMAALSCVMTPLAILAIAVIGPFMHLWVGSAVATQASPIGYILIAAYWINSFARIPWTLLQAEGRPDLCAKALALNLVPYAVALYFGLIYLGVTGAAAAWAFRAITETVSLYGFTGRGRALLKLAVPAVLVTSATVVALATPINATPRWLAMLLLGAVAAVVAYRTAPELLRRVTGLAALSRRLAT